MGSGRKTLRKPVPRAKVRRELADLWRRSGLSGGFELVWPDHMAQRHERCERSYAQVFTGLPPRFELAPQACYLPARHREGLLAHEVGHVLADPDGSEAAADRAALDVLGVEIGYDKRWKGGRGRGLEVKVNPQAEPGDTAETLADRLEAEGMPGAQAAKILRKEFGEAAEPAIQRRMARDVQWTKGWQVGGPGWGGPVAGGGHDHGQAAQWNPLPPEQRPVRDAKRQAAYEKRMAKKAESRAVRESARSAYTPADLQAMQRERAIEELQERRELGEEGLALCPWCGQPERVEVYEYWPTERKFMIDACCEGTYNEALQSMEHFWDAEDWQQFWGENVGTPIRSVGGKLEFRREWASDPRLADDVWTVDEGITLSRSVPLEGRDDRPEVALTIDELREYVRKKHKHADEPPAGALWGYAVWNGMPETPVYAGEPRFSSRKEGRRPLNLKRWPSNLIGAVLVGRPASRYTQVAGEAVRRVLAGETPEQVGADPKIKVKPSVIRRWVEEGEVRPGEKVAEVSRVAINHDLAPFLTYAASSAIYKQAAEDAKAAGYTKIQTFTLESETGMSLRYARWKPVAEGVGGGQFTREGRKRRLREGELEKPKTRWERRLA